MFKNSLFLFVYSFLPLTAHAQDFGYIDPIDGLYYAQCAAATGAVAIACHVDNIATPDGALECSMAIASMVFYCDSNRKPSTKFKNIANELERRIEIEVPSQKEPLPEEEITPEDPAEIDVPPNYFLADF